MNSSAAPQPGAKVPRETVFARLNATTEQIAAFCHRWQIAELVLFGSVVRDDFRPDSDIVVMVKFEPGAHIGFGDHMDMQEELERLFGREVDLIRQGTIRNPFRRHSIAQDLAVVYAA